MMLLLIIGAALTFCGGFYAGCAWTTDAAADGLANLLEGDPRRDEKLTKFIGPRHRPRSP